MKYAKRRADAEPSLQDDGDRLFMGVDERMDRTERYAGYVQEAVNKRFVDGAICTRMGIFEDPHFNAGIVGTWYASGVFSNPNGLEVLLIGTSSGVFACRHDMTPVQIQISGGESISAAGDLVQCFAKNVLFRGTGKAPLQWDGVFGHLYQPITQTGTGGTEVIPNAVTGTVYKDRLIVKQGKDNGAVSDIGNYTRYDPVLSEFKINEGDADELVKFKGWSMDRVAAFKSGSTHVLVNFQGDLSTLARKLVDGDNGCKAWKTVVEARGKLFFLSEPLGVLALEQVGDFTVQVNPVPVSHKIYRFINRINWIAAGEACAIADERYYYLAVPIDGATQNNAVAVLDLFTGEWQGYDVWPAGVSVTKFERITTASGKKVVAVDCVNRRCVVLNVNRYDWINGTRRQINDRVVTRFYHFQSEAWKKARRVMFQMKTWNPFLSVMAVTEGVKEKGYVAMILSKDRQKFYTFDPAFRTSTSARREDYSVKAEPGRVMTLEELSMAEVFQEQTEAFAMKAQGRYVAYEIVGSQGQSKLMSVVPSAGETKQTNKVMA